MNLKKTLKEFLSQYGKVDYILFVGNECQFKIELFIPISDMPIDAFTIFLMKLYDNILVEYNIHKKFKSSDKTLEIILSK